VHHGSTDFYELKTHAEHLTQLDLTPTAKPNEHREIDGDAEKTAITTTNILLEPSRHRIANPTARATSLPPEIVLEIASYLHPVDRICLALTCKSLLSSTLPTLNSHPADWVLFHDRRYSYLIPHMPMLYVRLAHGWIPKDRFRYCNHCYKILPRCPEYFKQRLRRKKKPKYDGRVGYTGVTEKQWNSMSKKKRYAHLLHDWCHSEKGDSSDYFCVYCCQKESEGGRERDREDDRERGSCSVHCPLCLEQDLTYRPPRKPWFRKTLGRCCKNFWMPLDLLAYWTLVCCVWGVRFVYDQGKCFWQACAGLCCSNGRS
jgi:hypothetical protein